MIIRSSKWSNRYTKSATDASVDASYFEVYDVRHVQDKFPEAPNYLTERLGKAISRRRQYLKYRERHAEKLAYAIEDDSVMAPSETTASVFHEEEITSYVKYRETDDFQSETSYASSISPSNSSRMPAMPKQAENEKHFECPYCHEIKIVKNTHEWRKHIFSDLQPFMCTFEDCATADKTYGGRREWFAHEISCHRRVWTCGGHCNGVFQSSEELIEHVKQNFSINITDQQIPTFLEMRSSPVIKTATSCCPLCHADIVTTKSLQRHLGKHLQELSLFAIPIKDEEDRLNSGVSDSNIQHSLSGSSDLHDENRSSRSIINSDIEPRKAVEKEPTSNGVDMRHEGPGEEKDRDLGKWLNQSYL